MTELPQDDPVRVFLSDILSHDNDILEGIAGEHPYEVIEAARKMFELSPSQLAKKDLRLARPASVTRLDHEGLMIVSGRYPSGQLWVGVFTEGVAAYDKTGEDCRIKIVLDGMDLYDFDEEGRAP